LDHLTDLPFVTAVDPPGPEVRIPDTRAAERVLVLRLNDGGLHELIVEIKRTNLSYAIAEGLIARARRRPGTPLLVVAPNITRGVGRALGDNGVNYVDAAGNCWLNIEDRYVAVIEGNRPVTLEPRGRGMGAAGYQVLFALLAMPDAENATLREIARQAGTALGTAARTLERLEDEGIVVRGRGRQVFLDKQEILERWLHGYTTQVRPKWLVGQFQTADRDPETRERRIAGELAKMEPKLNWAWGGGAGGMRLTGYYHGPKTVLLVEAPPADLPKMLRALPAGDGPLVLLEAPTALALGGPEEHVAHPLLIYTEMITARDERGREAAEELRERFLQ
jgi:hypothetical protein